MSPEMRAGSVGSLDLCLFAVVQVILVWILGSTERDLGAGRFFGSVDAEYVNHVELVTLQLARIAEHHGPGLVEVRHAETLHAATARAGPAFGGDA
jgi:hypothetical protein